MARALFAFGFAFSAVAALGATTLLGCSKPEDDADIETGDDQEIIAGSSDRYACVTNDEPGCNESVGIGKSLEAAEECIEGVDYDVTTKDENPNKPVILAIHGGKIEFGTAEYTGYLATELGWDHYTFDAHPSSKTCEEARWMHVTSNRFNATKAVKLAKTHPTAVTLHGYSERNADRAWARGEKLTICVGGLNAGARARFVKAINAEPIEVDGQTLYAYDASKASDASDAVCGGLQGQGATNVVNQAAGKGLQLELPGTLRAKLAGTKETAVDPKLRERLKDAIVTALGG